MKFSNKLFTGAVSLLMLMGSMIYAAPTNFNNGVSSYGIPVLPKINSEFKTATNTWWVDSNGSSSGSGSFDYPDKTLDKAINRCSAGDIIILKEGHAETISSSTALNADIAGVKIVGAGSGTRRAKITFDTATTTTIPVSANDITFENVIFSANFADIVACFTLTTAKNFKLISCEIVATAVDMNFTRVFDTNTTNNAADGLSFINSKWVDVDLSTETLVDIDADLDGLTIIDSYINLGVNTSDLPSLGVVATGKDITNLRVLWNNIIRLNDANALLFTLDTGTANTGVIAYNNIRHADIAAEFLVTTTTDIGFIQNYASAVADKSGYILPAVDS